MITSEWPTVEHQDSAPFIVQQVEFLRRAGVEVEVFAFRGACKPGNYLRAWRKTRRLIASGRFDLVHAQWGQSALLALPRSLPLVITYRGNDLEGVIGRNGRQSLQGRLLRAISRGMSRIAEEVVVVSDRLAHRMPPRAYHVIPSGLDLEMFRPMPQAEARARLGLPADRRLVLFAAPPTNPRKRHRLACAAVDLLDPALRAELVVATRVSHASMPLYMSACDAVILTSTHEGSPNVVKEALACDLPVASVDVGDVRLRIGNIEGCVVFADDRPETLAAGLDRVLRRGGRVAGRKSVTELDERLLAVRTISVYRKALRRA